ncbi:hypothetical protein D9611_001595 [Ephemerocybe angulata]|uniref:Calcineurin-like phosphoesterase domain-containing protein n=1 Tax=Ephemerocybe angulata TaxID=980116 RepID=A0A8H5FMB1_9AGAR|nr:hypothetical protein D9611_001595 [Tulosesus angulatus]
MWKPFRQLLSKVDYASTSDVLVHAGDFLAKGPHHHSMAILNYMTINNITGVRGNHDQQVVEWRGWINWVSSSKEGLDWLKRTEHHWKVLHGNHPADSRGLDDDLDDFVQSQKDKAPSKDRRWWKLIPAGWKFLSGQYRIAREMSEEQYEYLLQLPTALYVPSAHAFVVHAGILPSDPNYPYYDASRQPLAHIPDVFPSITEKDRLCRGSKFRCTNQLRQAQEMSILTDVPQNRRPWVLMNMRGVKNGKVFRQYRGVFWAKLWNRDMKRCVGYNGELASLDSDDEESEGKPKAHNLPCYPSTVVYGHSASRGLSIKRWTMGLDSGCVYGRKMTALVMGGSRSKHTLEGDGDSPPFLGVDDVDEAGSSSEDDEEDDAEYDFVDGFDDHADDSEDSSSHRPASADTLLKKRKKKKEDGDIVPFGGHHRATIVSVKCH